MTALLDHDFDWATIQQQRLIAIHEAGHALMAVVLHGEACISLSVSILPPRFSGWTRTCPSSRSPPTTFVQAVALAGPSAEFIYCKNFNLPYPPVECILEDLAKTDSDSVEAFALVHRMLSEKKYWGCLVHLADRLGDYWPSAQRSGTRAMPAEAVRAVVIEGLR